MKNKNQSKSKFSLLTCSLYLIAGIIYVIAAVMRENYGLLPIGCAFFALGCFYAITENIRRRTNQLDSETDGE